MKKKTALLGMLLSVALICGYIETLIPFGFGIPGIKLGLTNVVILMALYLYGTKEALTLSVLRVFLIGILFGNVFSILYSLAGGLLSLVVMFILKKTERVSCISVSVLGGIFHNIGQLVVAAFIVSNYYVFYYIPVLLIAGFLTGLLIGVIAQEVLKRLGGKDVFIH